MINKFREVFNNKSPLIFSSDSKLIESSNNSNNHHNEQREHNHHHHHQEFNFNGGNQQKVECNQQ